MRRAILACTLLGSLALAHVARADGAARARAGFTIAADVRAAAFELADAPSVIVHAPAGFDARGPLHLVVYLHGYTGCVSVLMGRGPSRCRPSDDPQLGWDLGAHHDAANTNTLFIVPQLAFMKASGRPGAFGKPALFREFLRELLAETLKEELGGPRTLDDVAGLTLLAHSAGYETALAVIERGGVDDLVRHIVLFDALYGGTPGYARFIEAHAARGLRFVAIHLGYGATYRNGRALYKRLKRKLGASRVTLTDSTRLDQALTRCPIVFSSGKAPHKDVPANYMAGILRALELPARNAPPSAAYR